MSKHTPGPWSSRHIDGFPTSIVAEGAAIAVASSHDNGTDTELPAEANARLMAAAPELLEALEKAGDLIDYLASMADYVLPPEAVPYRDAVRDAIVKATGRKYSDA